MGPDLKKISVTTWLILGGIFLYTASLWQRPLFVSEFAENSGAINALCSGSSETCSDFVRSFLFKYTGFSPFAFRIPNALLALLAGVTLLLAGRNSSFSRISTAAALMFLLSPAIFLSGTAALSFMVSGAPVIISFYLLYLMSESNSGKRSFLWGCGALVFSLPVPFFQGRIAPLLFVLAVWLVYAVSSLFLKSPEERGRREVLRHFTPALYLVLALLPPIFINNWQHSVFALPRSSDLKTLAAFAAAGSFPWILFMTGAMRNFSERFRRLCRDSFTRSALVLAAASFIMALFTPASAAFFVPFLGGMAVLLAAGLEMEHEENGFRSFNIILYILAVVFFLAAAGIGTWSALGIYTNLLNSACKIFSARDAWALTAIVPAVAAVWCLTAAGEKISKERKFLSLCAGIAFLLLAFHGLVPLKVIEYNAPGNFLKKVVLSRTGTEACFYGDASMLAPLQTLLKGAQIKLLSHSSSATEIKEGLKAGKKMCVVTLSQEESKKLPFPKTTLRSGNFIAVFYNIDFPEMRVRKP